MSWLTQVGGAWTRLGSRILFGCRKSPKMPQNPHRPLHALWLAFCWARLFGWKKHCRQTDKIIAQTLYM